ncbi:MAG: ABC transporter substrate-binding protein [Filomicrobium sp.]
MNHAIRKTLFVLLAAILLPVTAVSGADTASKPATDAGPRIVSVGSDITEILYELGLGEKIVAVDTTSTFPAQALKEKSNVGYMRALSAEGVLALAPTMILATRRAGPPEAVKALKSSSVKFVEVPDEHTADGILQKIAMLAEATGREKEAQRLTKTVSDAFDALNKDREAITTRKRVLFVLNASGDRMIVGGKGTSAEAALRLAGAKNAADSITGFKPITPEGLVAMAPDAIVLMRGGRDGDDAKALAQRPAVKLTPAGAHPEPMILPMGGSYLIGFGPRTPKAVRELMTWLYPEIGKAELGGNKS